MIKKVSIFIIFISTILVGCSKTSDFPTIFSLESVSGKTFEEDTVQNILGQYGENQSCSLAAQLFFKYFSITGYEDGKVIFNSLDVKKIFEVLDDNDLEILSQYSEEQVDNLLKILYEKSEMPTVSESATVNKKGDVYESNYFIAEKLEFFLMEVLQNGEENVNSILKNYRKINKNVIETLEVNKAKLIQITMQGKSVNVCLTIDEVLTSQQALDRLKEKNILNTYEIKPGSIPVYLQYTIVNLSQESISLPEIFINVDSAYEKCELNKQPVDLKFPSICEPLKETKYEKLFLLENEKSNIYLINDNQIFYRIGIGGNNEK